MKNLILTYGGLFGLILSVSSYLYMNTMIGTTMSMVLTFGALFLTTILAGLSFRKSQEGFASFGELIKLFVGVILLGLLISIVIGLVLISMMDEATKNTLSENMLNNALSMYESMGIPQEQIDIMSDELEEKFQDVFSPGMIVQGGLINFVVYFLLSLIPAAILKKN